MLTELLEQIFGQSVPQMKDQDVVGQTVLIEFAEIRVSMAGKTRNVFCVGRMKFRHEVLQRLFVVAEMRTPGRAAQAVIVGRKKCGQVRLEPSFAEVEEPPQIAPDDSARYASIG